MATTNDNTTYSGIAFAMKAAADLDLFELTSVEDLVDELEQAAMYMEAAANGEIDDVSALDGEECKLMIDKAQRLDNLAKALGDVFDI